MKNKSGMEFNFPLLFAIVAGIAILVLAIYGAMRIGDTQRYQTDSEIAKKIGILTEPLQSGFATGSYGRIEFKSETRVNNRCFSKPSFGKNEISVSTRSGIGKEWNLPGGASSVYNKYIFSDNEQQGKKYYVFSKPFEFGFKVSDLVFLTTGDYCFVSPPDVIEDELIGLNMENIKAVNDSDYCGEDSESVCFGGGGCDIRVYGTCMTNCETVYEEGYVEKGGERFDFVSGLMYGAIFSDFTLYDCNVKRLMYRTGKVAEIFSEKTNLMDARGCNTNLKPDLILLGGMAMNATSRDIIGLNQIAKELNKRESLEACGLW